MSDENLSRRSALGAAGLIVAGGVAGYVAGRNTDAAKALPAAPGGAYGGPGGYGGPDGSHSGGSMNHRLAPVADIPDGGGVIVGTVVVTRSGSQVHAFSAICTHQGCQVNQVSGGKIDCPCHGSVFDASTGAVVAGPAPSPLPPVAIAVHNGEVFTS
jgi:Rieske Fe-S protein